MKSSLSNRVNIKTVFDFLFNNGDHSIAEIAEGTLLSSPTVTKCVNVLQKKNLVNGKGRVALAKGRQPIVYGIDAENVLLLGVDAKTNCTSMGIVTARGDILKKNEYALVSENPGHALAQMIEAVNRFLDETPNLREKICCANFNISGRVNAESGRSYSQYIFEDESESLAAVLSKGISLPSFIENDTRAMAFAENILGAGRQFKTFLYINISAGIGLSIISDGKIYKGRDGYSGEIGHTNLYDNNIICQCGKKGCLETEVSGKALCRKLQERVAGGDMTILSSKINKRIQITENDIIDAALAEDPLAIELLGKSGDELGKTIANLINIFNPEAVIIGGGLSRAGGYFLQPTLYGVTKYSLSRLSKNVVIRYSDVTDAGLRGAGLIACRNYFNTTI